MKYGSMPLDLPAVLLVGGLGTRLRSVLSDQPKPLLRVGNRPFLEILVSRLHQKGIRRLIMSTGYLADQIEQSFGDGRALDVEIIYSREDSPLGTAGALKRAQEHIDVPEFLVVNGDSFLEVDLHDLLTFHKQHESAVTTIVLLRTNDAGRYGSVTVDSSGAILRFREKRNSIKSTLINAGMYLCSSTLWPYIPEGPCSLERCISKPVWSRTLRARTKRLIHRYWHPD